MHTCICVSGGIGTGRGVGAILAEDFAGQASVVTISCVPIVAWMPSIMEGDVAACLVAVMVLAVAVCVCYPCCLGGGGSKAKENEADPHHALDGNPHCVSG